MGTGLRICIQECIDRDQRKMKNSIFFKQKEGWFTASYQHPEAIAMRKMMLMVGFLFSVMAASEAIICFLITFYFLLTSLSFYLLSSCCKGVPFQIFTLGRQVLFLPLLMRSPELIHKISSCP